MARIRYLKPDFFKDEHIKDLPYEARLFYQGLWVQADKEGRGEDRPVRLKTEIMPYDGINPEKLMEMLAHPKKDSKRPYIVRYEVGGEKYYQILHWHKHQKPHHTERDSEIPPPPKEAFNRYLTVKEPLLNSKELLQVHGDGDGDGKGNGDGSKASPALKAALEKVYKQGLNIYALINKLKKQ